MHQHETCREAERESSLLHGAFKTFGRIGRQFLADYRTGRADIGASINFPMQPAGATAGTSSEVTGDSLRINRYRLRYVIAILALIFVSVGFRLVSLTWPDKMFAAANAEEPVRSEVPSELKGAGEKSALILRADITDRDGRLLATDLPAASLYARPQDIRDAGAAAHQLIQVFPDQSYETLKAALESSRNFVWIKRHLTPRQHEAVLALGLPGLNWLPAVTRAYPKAALTAHVIGHTDTDNRGVAGVEHTLDDRLTDPAALTRPLTLSIDIPVQFALRSGLQAAIERHRAKAASGLVMDAETGELLGMISLPDFDPHQPHQAGDRARRNSLVNDVFELGSIFKVFTVAMALESGVVGLSNGYDATEPIKVGRFWIRDDHPQERWLSVPEILIHSSNIGAAKMAMAVGPARQRHFLNAMGLFHRAGIELPGRARPIVPQRWRDSRTMTVAYGHGIAVSPLSAAAAIAAVVNGGVLRAPTLLRQAYAPSGRRVFSPDTSAAMRKLMRRVVTEGTGGQADRPGYRIGGKTGTAEKNINGAYLRDRLLTSFAAFFPSDKPRYVVFVMLDEPQATAATKGFRGAGWTAAPAAGEIIEAIAPLLGVRPDWRDPGPRPQKKANRALPLPTQAGSPQSRGKVTHHAAG